MELCLKMDGLMADEKEKTRRHRECVQSTVQARNDKGMIPFQEWCWLQIGCVRLEVGWERAAWRYYPALTVMPYSRRGRVTLCMSRTF